MSVLGRKFHAVAYFSFAFIWALYGFGYLITSASQSAHYQLIETSLGGTGSVGSQSANYQSQQSGGVTGLGTSTGTAYQVQAGHETTNDPTLSFSIISPSPNLGSFSPTTTSTATAQFEVVDYTSYGYTVEMYGTPPTNSYGYKIKALSSNAAPQVGVEQYGYNLVANTIPSSFGANPVFGQFGSGYAATNYNTPNSYRFVNGEEIAYSGKSSGQTIYTISYIVNVSSLTPGGQYSSVQNVLCVGTY